MRERWPSRAGWPILRVKVAYPPARAHRAGIRPESRRAPHPPRWGVAVALLAAWRALARCPQEVPATASPKKTESGTPGASPRAVGVVPAAEATVARTVSATGTLAADEQ